jgi:hypothetical protein
MRIIRSWSMPPSSRSFTRITRAVPWRSQRRCLHLCGAFSRLRRCFAPVLRPFSSFSTKTAATATTVRLRRGHRHVQCATTRRQRPRPAKLRPRVAQRSARYRIPRRGPWRWRQPRYHRPRRLRLRPHLARHLHLHLARHLHLRLARHLHLHLHLHLRHHRRHCHHPPVPRPKARQSPPHPLLARRAGRCRLR